jgi:Uma2 family endonuclease
MPTALPEILPELPPLVPPRKRWTRAECALIEGTGVLAEQHVELVQGELIDKFGKNRPHGIALALLMGWLIDVFGRRFVQQEVSIDVAPDENPTNEPEPDAIVLGRDLTTVVSNPLPSELRLVVEVADSTLSFDLTTKAGLYARAGIVEYWVIDVVGKRLIAHREPANGNYHSITAFGENESVAPIAALEHSLRVGDVFPQ